MKRHVQILAAAIVAIASWDSPQVVIAAPEGTLLTLTGQQAPGTDPGVAYQSANSAIINANGLLSFYGALQGPGVTNDNHRGFWVGEQNSLSLVARTGGQAPGFQPGFNYSAFLAETPWGLNDAGQVAIRANVYQSAPKTGYQAIFTGSPEQLSPVVRSGQAAPGVPLQSPFQFLYDPAFNSQGQVAFRSTLAAGSSSPGWGIWRGTSSSLTPVVIDNDQAIGYSAGVQFSTFPSNPSLNDLGHVVFQSSVNGPGITTNNRTGIWLSTSQENQLIARMGQQAPGLASGIEFGQFHLNNSADMYPLNNADQVVFGSKLAGAGITTQNDSSLWLRQPTGPQLIAREGDQIPGSDMSWGDLSLPYPLLNQSGHASFNAKMSGPGVNTGNDTGIWMALAGEVALTAREGDQAPGMDPGILFGDFTQIVGIALNGLDQLAFNSRLTGSGIDMTNDEALWVRDQHGMLRLIAREGDLFEVSPGDYRTIRLLGAIRSRSHEGGHLSGLSENGMFSYQLVFTDNSYATLLTTVPEPTSIALWMSATLVVMCRRRSRTANIDSSVNQA